MPKTYKAGIVGFGWAGEAHFTSFLKSGRYLPCAVMSTRTLDPADFREKYGVDVKIYHEYDAFLKDPDVEVVDICTPHFLHAEQAISASETGKAVIIEKPLALTYEDTKRVLHTVRKNGTKTSVCFEVRFVPSVAAMKSFIELDLLGEPYYVEADYYHGIGPWYANQRWEVKREQGGSSLLRAGCHALDILLWLTGWDIDEVFTYGNTNPHKVFAPYDYDLNTATLLKSVDGKVGKVTSCTDCMQPYVFNVNIVGSHGSIKNDQFYSKKIEGLRGWSKQDVVHIDSGEVSHHPYAEQFAFFAECLDQGKDPHNSLESAFYTHKVLFAADRSSLEGRPVKLSEYD